MNWQIEYTFSRTLQTVRELGRHFGTVTRCEVLPVPEIVKVDGDWRVDCAYDYAIIIYPNAPQVYRFIIENGVLKPTHPIYTRVGGYKVATFLEMYHQNYQEYYRLRMLACDLTVAEGLYADGGRIAKKMKITLDAMPNQRWAQECREEFNGLYTLLKQYTT